jgi:hypothetical protein
MEDTLEAILKATSLAEAQEIALKALNNRREMSYANAQIDMRRRYINHLRKLPLKPGEYEDELKWYDHGHPTYVYDDGKWICGCSRVFGLTPWQNID